MNTDDFIDATAPEILYRALEPITPPTGNPACAAYLPERFVSPQRQQAAFDGDPVDPAADCPAARAICYSCPLLAACRRYAEDSGDQHAFLGGLSADQRFARRRKDAEMIKRRRQVAALREIGAPTGVIADLLGRDPSLIRGDLRLIERARSAV
ncbi:WhiB family transcriptional regulator [Nocardia niigatensis]